MDLTGQKFGRLTVVELLPERKNAEKVYKCLCDCDEWKDDFQTFYNWAMNNNYRDDLTIDRIDNNKGYSPENCKWSTPKQQVRNKITCRMV